ncbi:hypothetical protein LXL04_007237 [Taraxacum kok-saghyz]
MAPKKEKQDFAAKKMKMKKDSKMKQEKKKLHSTSGTPTAAGGTENRGVDSYWWRNNIEYICSLVREDFISRPPSGLINIEGRLLSVEKQVAIALRRLASGESQVSVGASFNVGQSTVSQVTWRFIEAMEERAIHHLKWPDNPHLQKIKSEFEKSFNLPRH